MAGFSNDIMFASNVNFAGGKTATVTTDGQLLIGSTAAPNIRVGTITAGSGISITNGSGSITIEATGGASVVAYTRSSASPTTITSSDYFVSIDSSGGAITARLPSGASTGKVYYIKDGTGSAAVNAVTIDTAGAELIDGSATFTLNTPYQAIGVIYNGTNWEIF